MVSSTVNILKVSDKMAYAKGADPDQTAPSSVDPDQTASDRGLHCLSFH